MLLISSGTRKIVLYNLGGGMKLESLISLRDKDGLDVWLTPEDYMRSRDRSAKFLKAMIFGRWTQLLEG
jgi:hypothetical protein